MSDRNDEITRAGGRVVGITVDSPEQNSAMIEKLRLPFPILSDPDRSGAIEPYDVANPTDPRNLAIPSLFIIKPDGMIADSWVSIDYADRTSEEAMVEALQALELPPVSPEPVEIGPTEPGPKAMPLHAMEPYFRGARFAVAALRGRHPELGSEADAYVAQMDRYLELTRSLRASTND